MLKQVEYPFNLIVEIGPFPWHIDLARVERDFDDVLMHYFAKPGCLLNEREQQIILMRYKDKKSLAEIGAHFEITRERVRQLEAKSIRRLKYLKEMFYSFDELLELENEHEKRRLQLIKKIEELDKLLEKADSLLATKETTIKDIEEFFELSEEERKSVLQNNADIVELDLSVRSYNCLRRARINTIGELKTKTRSDLLKIRNMGRKSAKAIIEKLREIGIELQEE